MDNLSFIQMTPNTVSKDTINHYYDFVEFSQI